MSMNDSFSHSRPRIVLFKKNAGAHAPSYLKTFLLFLKHLKAPGPYRFSHVDSMGHLRSDLSLQANLLLESNCQGLNLVGKSPVSDYLEKLAPGDYSNLLDFLPALSSMPKDISPEQRKFVALLKVFLQKDKEYILLDHPENTLNETMQLALINALERFIVANNIILFVHSDNHQFWAPYIEKTVEIVKGKFLVQSIISKEINGVKVHDLFHQSPGHLIFQKRNKSAA